MISNGCWPNGCRPVGPVCSELPVPADQSAVDLLVEVTSPAGETALLAVEIKARVEPRRVPELARRIEEATSEGMPGVVPVLGAAYLSPSGSGSATRVGCRLHRHDRQHFASQRALPGCSSVMVAMTGDPWPRRDVLQSLRGPRRRLRCPRHRRYGSPVRCARTG